MQKKIVIYTDGGARGNPGPAGAGLHIADEQGETLHQDAVFLGHKTNNEAEYLALQHAVLAIESLTLSDINTHLDFYLDSKLVVEQISRRWKIKEARLQELASSIWQKLSALPHSRLSFTHVAREKNKIADQLANQAMDQAAALD